MPARFILRKGLTGKFRFSLVAANGDTVASSEAYRSKDSAMKGIASVQWLATVAEIEDRTKPGR